MILRVKNYGWSEDGSYYGAEVYGGEDVKGDLVIPSAVDGVAVKKIGCYAFENNDSLTSVTIPPDMEYIHDLAFGRCHNLKTVTLPKMRGAIGGSAFADCSSLKNISLPEGLKEIGDRTFQNCTSLEHIVIPKSVRGVGDFTFENCTSLKSIVFLGNTEVSATALIGCSALESVDLPPSPVCKRLPSIKAPDTLKRVSVAAGGYHASDWEDWLHYLFYVNPNLRELILPADAEIGHNNELILPPHCRVIRI